MHVRTLTRPGPLAAIVAILLMAAALVLPFSPASGRTAPSASSVAAELDAAATRATKPTTNGELPTVVLVHGAFADSSGWNEVSVTLQKKGYEVHAWSNPLRGLAPDAEYLRSYLGTIDGPIILVGHSYGGAVIGEASTGNSHVEALIYVAAYALAQGENIAHANELGGGHSTVIDNIVLRPYPGASGGDADAIVNPDAFRDIFAADLPKSLTQAMAVSQRPAVLSSLILPAGEPGWETIPSYYLIAENDHLISPAAQHVMAERAGATTETVQSSHVLMMTNPDRVVNFVFRATEEH